MTVAHGIRFDVRRAVAVTAVALAGAIGALVAVLWLAGSTNAFEVQLGDPDFRGINAADLAAEIAENGPVPFPDLVGRDLPLWITHTGSDPTTGWSAFSAWTPGGANHCLVQWDAGTSTFVDSCDPLSTWPADGRGLGALAWQVVDGELRVAVSGERPDDWATDGSDG